MANKIVAAIHSTAAPSPFPDAAYTIHGDLGMIQNEAPVATSSKKHKHPRNHCSDSQTSGFTTCCPSKVRSSFWPVRPQKSLTHGRMPSVALSIKKIVSNNQQGGFIAYVAREDNEFIHPAAVAMTKIPTSTYRNHCAGEPWLPQPENSLLKHAEIDALLGLASSATPMVKKEGLS